MVKNSESHHITQDEQIEYLESQVQAYKARTSLLQQQQISTLDTLDEVVQQNRQEFDEEFTARRLLEQRLRRSRDALTEVEKERDELRDVVLELIEKVEKSGNDFKLWPYSKLQLSSYTDLEPKQSLSVQPSQVQQMQENLAYAGGIVRALKHELLLERQAHTQTRARVHTLEAQVAGRDAALEAWAQHTQNSTPIGVRTQNKNGKGTGSRKGKGLETQRDLDRAEISSLLLQTVTNNRTLEQEIRILFSNLEKARLKTEAPAVQPQPQPTSPLPPTLLMQSSKKAQTSRPSSPDRGRAKERKVTHHVPQERRTHTRPSSPHHNNTKQTYTSPQPIAGPSKPPPFARTLSPRRKPSLPPGTATYVQDQRSLSPPRRVSSQSPSRHRTPSRLPAPATPPHGNALQHLNDQIHLLSAQIDAFRAERAALLRVIDSQLRGRDKSPVAALSDEGDTSSLLAHDTHVEEFRRTEAEAGHDETDDRQPKKQVDFDDASEEEGTEGGERSMDLATPLFPVPMMLLAVDSHVQEAHPPPRSPTFVSDSGPSRSRSRSRVRTEDREDVVGLEDVDENEIRMIRPRVGFDVSPPPP